MTAHRLVIWRHGRTTWNRTGRFQGQADIALDELGEVQAKAAAPALAAMAPGRIVASDLIRAQQTAAQLAEQTGLPVSADPRLREIHVGSWEGLTADEVARIDPERARKYLAGEDVRRSATGETVGEVADRVAEALTEVAEQADDGQTVVVVMHGLAARVGACRLVGLPQDHWRLLASVNNCAWISLTRHHRSGYWQIEGYNVTGGPTTADPV